MKNEVILVSPGQKGFFLRGLFLNDFFNGVVSKIAGFLVKEGPKRADTPLNILFVGTALKEAGFTPRLIDGRFEDIRRKLKEYLSEKTLFVGISSMTSYQIIFGIKTASAVRKMRPDLPIVWGGLHPTVLPEETLRTCEYADIVCKGEGERTVVELARALQREEPLGGIAGIGYKDKDGRIVMNKDREFLDFDKLPLPDYGLLDPRVFNLSFLSYQSSRGCPHRCKFCEVGPIHKRSYRRRSIETAIRDVEELINKHPIRLINIIDENFFVNLGNARLFANTVMERGWRFQWRAWCRADYFRRTDTEFWRLMRKAGLRDVEIGGESGSQKTLDNICKDYKVSDITNAASQLHDAGITAKISFMCSLPGEDRNDMDETVKMIDHLYADFPKTVQIQMFLYMPLPQTPFYEELKAEGCRFPTRLEDWGKFIWGGKNFARWHPHHEYAFRLSIVSRWARKIPAAKIFTPLKQLDAFVSMLFLCGYLSYYRWQKKFFGIPVDIYLQYWLNKYIFRYLWQG